MRKTALTLFLFGGIILAFISCGGPKNETVSDQSTQENNEQVEESKPVIESPRNQAEGEVSGVKVMIDYGSPAVKGRQIWGGLEPYGEVWRAGANETTAIEFSAAVNINGTEIPAGKYGFYIIPNESTDWVAILNTDWDRKEHGAWGAHHYTEDHDVVRITVPAQVVDDNMERLEYQVSNEGILFAWEKVRLTIPLSPGS